MTEDAPDWLRCAVREAHQSDAPNDWIYEECRAACDAIDDGSLSDEDDVHAHADGRVDVYTQALYQWAADMCLSDTFAGAEEELSDCGGGDADTVGRLSALQFFAIARIVRTILEAFEASKDEES